VAFSVQDEGTGIAPEVAARLFTPFFSTRTEGMGLGLSLCRTVIEQHGGALDFEAVHDGPQALPGAADEQDVAGVWLRGARFRFTLPAASPAVSRLDTPSS
jgi:two-component system sensor histidine kinase DctS